MWKWLWVLFFLFPGAHPVAAESQGPTLAQTVQWLERSLVKLSGSKDEEPSRFRESNSPEFDYEIERDAGAYDLWRQSFSFTNISRCYTYAPDDDRAAFLVQCKTRGKNDWILAQGIDHSTFGPFESFSRRKNYLNVGEFRDKVSADRINKALNTAVKLSKDARRDDIF